MILTKVMTIGTRMRNDVIVPEWPAPPNVSAIQTTRKGGCSLPPYESFNLGSHVGDDPMRVEHNRNMLNEWLPSEPVWLEQVHGTQVVFAETAGCRPVADACVTKTKNAVCVVMTADCLPVLLCDQGGTVVAAVHAGWRGLADGVIESAVKSMAVAPRELIAWLGPAIGPEAFEVGPEVRDIFTRQDAAAAQFFSAMPNTKPEDAGKSRADLFGLARLRLHQLEVDRIYGGGWCTYQNPDLFFSYRRDGQTGRMATMIWMN